MDPSTETDLTTTASSDSGAVVEKNESESVNNSATNGSTSIAPIPISQSQPLSSSNNPNVVVVVQRQTTPIDQQNHTASSSSTSSMGVNSYSNVLPINSAKVSEVFLTAGLAFQKLGDLTLALQTPTGVDPSEQKWSGEEVDMLHESLKRFADDLNNISNRLNTRTTKLIGMDIRRRTAIAMEEGSFLYRNSNNANSDLSHKKNISPTALTDEHSPEIVNLGTQDEDHGVVKNNQNEINNAATPITNHLTLNTLRERTHPYLNTMPARIAGQHTNLANTHRLISIPYQQNTRSVAINPAFQPMSAPRVGTVIRRQTILGTSRPVQPQQQQTNSAQCPRYSKVSDVSAGTRGISIVPGNSRRLLNFNAIPPSNAYLSAGSKLRQNQLIQTPSSSSTITTTPTGQQRLEPLTKLMQPSSSSNMDMDTQEAQTTPLK